MIIYQISKEGMITVHLPSVLNAPKSHDFLILNRGRVVGVQMYTYIMGVFFQSMFKGPNF